MEIKAAITPGALCGLIINPALFLRFKKEIKLSEIKPLLTGAFLGIPAGAFFLRDINPSVVKTIPGIIILSYSLPLLSEIIKPGEIKPKWSFFCGILSGILGGAFTHQRTSCTDLFIYAGPEQRNSKNNPNRVLHFYLGSDCIFAHCDRINKHGYSGTVFVINAGSGLGANHRKQDIFPDFLKNLQ